ncbi:E3 ubiquitin-protein ligase RAD18 isoform X3 [Dipodomys spectabilis]|uniref:E3 ubiquitin-protein ligase RAD18 isoform X3 n=1 Tax=Dipodomys spectabilis TaxID=105255 RepID=UPI001C549168|nr:E3 ubiquitin-protein ligase RAD18 isoform X3 [Dipodomys spectabilis]
MEPLVEPRWPAGLEFMKTIDDLLRCGICFEYFNIAMIIPQCSHNYCSLCIRKFLSYKTQCPTCCVVVTEPDLKNNRILDELVKSMSFARSVHKRKPLPKTVYNLLSDRDLKKKLKQHGLSVQGNKQQLIKRHQEFVHMYNAQCDALHPKSAAEIAQELENMEKTRMRLEASKLNESMMVFTKDQTESEIDEIHSKYRKKHQNEFQLLVDQAKKGYKKTGWTSENKATGKGQEDVTVKFSDTTLVTNHSLQSKPGSPGRSEPAGPDDSSGCTDIQEVVLFSSESDSCNSSSSDIIRDLLEEEEAWEESYKNDLQDREVSPRQNRRTRAAENAETEPRNKRNRN